MVTRDFPKKDLGSEESVRILRCRPPTHTLLDNTESFHRDPVPMGADEPMRLQATGAGGAEPLP